MKKVLIITYYWPPNGGSGVQRWLKFAKYLPQNGWRPIIYTPENPSFDVPDDSLMNDIDSNIDVWKTQIWEPYNLKDWIFGKNNSDNAGIIEDKLSLKTYMLNWFRGNLFIPDPKVFWVKKSINFLIEKINKEGITHIISTGPPHSMHLIALGLKRLNHQLKWIADFRDPWSELDLFDSFHLTNIAKKRHVKLESQVLELADLCITVSETWVKSFERLGSKNVKLITNGFDPDDFNGNYNINNKKYVIGHFGLLNHLRNPINFWRKLNDLCEEYSDFKDKLEIRLSGNIDSSVIQSITKNFHLKNKVNYLGYLSHRQVIKEYQKSNVLLLLLFNSHSGIGNYPGKLFEYFAANKPIIAFGPEGSDTEKLLDKIDSSIYFNYNEEVNESILDFFNHNKNNVYNYDNYNRINLTKNLADLLKNI
tara:strand:- start:10649 stop:11914 length:1266 start_codon:yes stop_codon:yes gene_type:complete